jgi:hypothetical protein
MITTLAALLEALRTTEAEVLKKHDIKHGPTIGDMYEGLTREILSRAIPAELGLRVVEGFIEGLDGEKSNQGDVLLVRGDGRQIPYTDKFIWPIQNVLAIFEVKKTLYSDSLKDAFTKMWKVSELHKAFQVAGGYDGKDVSFGHKNFAKLTGFYPKLSQVDNLPDPLPLIHYSMLSEQLAPIRIILGYEGFVDEAGLRKGIIRFLLENGAGANRGFLSLPSLVICRQASVIKSNGMPYYCPLDDYREWWHTMASNSENPTRLLLEAIWTKISAETGLSLPMDDSLNQEKFAPFLRQKFVEVANDGVIQSGFACECFESDPASCSDEQPFWQPHDADLVEYVTLMRAGQSGFVTIDDPHFQQFAIDHGTTALEILTSLVRKRVLAWTDITQRIARPIENSFATVFTPDGKSIVSDQAGLLGLWIQNEVCASKSAPGVS